MAGAAPGPAAAPTRGFVRSALAAAVCWLVIEFVTRHGVLVVAALAFAGDALPPPGTLGILNSLALWPAMAVLGAVFLRMARRQQLGSADLGYRRSSTAVLIGVASGGGILVLTGLASQVDGRLFDQSAVEILREAWAEGGLLNAAILLPANAILGPVVEEFAWRGYIQTRLIRAWGVPSGVLVTACLFAAKHMVVDLWLGRTTTLVVSALGLGIVGSRWGTLASTVAHIGLNLTGTILALRSVGVL